ncbi:tetratricopeptide repeat protein [Tuwongella immobilis]|uniref:Tetratricopeptide repeat protein n=1 Tax=Tuwongella immobilis TaxID=692036 RepID=A0A6C2YVJ6_9BACT|nr:tetratricopeptide repeat protein [Tuwongella immobilis]VIP05397.1 o-linked c transferase : TPR repeat OS=alpha proteobacterium BAL199 GN=BAL199_09375 PE=4 SV=1: TPR_19: TPR_9: TPR_9 [Tuwongella immobilis]VTS08150.1 o-linked c transferase : TPR repeat OS=alpha proteobacterium BAL199 GN=BAL199_09375 PE=4 SV=1: TPR_19: TPR_9: TPR_9 [Tuwongella immobilis]
MWHYRHPLGIACLVMVGAVGCSREHTRPAPQSTIPGMVAPASTGEPPLAGGMLSRSSRKSSEPKVLRPDTLMLLAEMRTDAANAGGYSDSQRQALLQSAKDHYQQVLAQVPNHAGAMRGLARLHDQSGDVASAHQMYQQMLQQTPKDGSLWYEYAMSKARRQDYQGAIETLHQGMGYDPQEANLKKAMGFCLAQTGRVDEGCQWLMQTMPEADARANLAGVLLKSNQHQAAKTQLEMAMRLNPNHPTAVSLAQAFGRPADAQPETNVVLTAMPIATGDPSKLPPLPPNQPIQQAQAVQPIGNSTPSVPATSPNGVIPAMHTQPIASPMLAPGATPLMAPGAAGTVGGVMHPLSNVPPLSPIPQEPMATPATPTATPTNAIPMPNE